MQQALQDNRYYTDIETTEQQWYQLGISGVPTIVFNNQTVDFYLQMLSEQMATH